MNKPGHWLPYWLTMNEVAVMLSVSRRTIRRWVAEGRLPAGVRFTRRTLRWCRDDLFGVFSNGPLPVGTFPKNRGVK